MRWLLVNDRLARQDPPLLSNNHGYAAGVQNNSLNS